jgi:hypothetical protein
MLSLPESGCATKVLSDSEIVEVLERELEEVRKSTRLV